ncbi:MAG: ATP-grasp domain-containing protein [Holophagales bacterium]|nr:ATP-grasp domain-containing protein [Holophagales bacterium]
MAYVFLDPCGEYPRHLVSFLGKAGHGAVAVFSSRGRYLLWRDKWSAILGDYVLGSFGVWEAPTLDHLARAIRRRWGQPNGVIPWDEETVLLGAALSDSLGLGWNSLEVIERCRDKSVMKAWLRESGDMRLNAAATVEDAEGALAFQRRVGKWPIVVKPTAGSGSEDVYFSGSDAELLRDCQRVLRAGAGEVLLEEFIGGHEVVINGIVDERSDLLITDVWIYDRRPSHGIPNLFYETFRVPTGAPIFRVVSSYAAEVVETLELRRAPIHMEVKVDDDGPCLIEVGARFSGGSLPILASKLHGRSILELAACHYLADMPLTGRDLDYARYDRYEARVLHGVQSRELGRIRRVHGEARVRALPSFQGFGRLRQPGMRAPLTRDLDSTAWELYLIHDDLGQIEHDARVARQVLRYE